MISSGSDNMVMPVAPMYGSGNASFGGGCFGGDWAWIILLLLLAGNGWGNGFGGGFGGDGVMPYLWNTQTQNDVNRGFDNSGLASQLSGIQNAITTGFANAEMSNFQGYSNISSQLAQCCCENRLATANLGSDIAREACATRTSDTQNTQTLLNAITGGIQSIKDQMCNDKIDAKNDEIAQLRQEILYARGQASQVTQNQQIVDSIYNRLDTCPVGTTPVYGRTPIFTCNNGCGCNA